MLAHAYSPVTAAGNQAASPVSRPTWVGATYASGDGWNVADAGNLTAQVAEVPVRRLGTRGSAPQGTVGAYTVHLARIGPIGTRRERTRSRPIWTREVTATATSATLRIRK